MKKTHPLAAPAQSTIALFTKGRQPSIIRDSFLLMKQAAPLLPKGENVLYINTLTNAAIVQEVADKISDRYDREVCTFTATSRFIMERLEFLAHTITAKNIKLVILNSFEFAAVYSRQRVKLATWLREMRDMHGVSVVVYSMHAAQTMGALGTLSWLADRTQEVGDWQYEFDDTLIVEESALSAGQEFSAMLDTEEASEDYLVDRRDKLQLFNFPKLFVQDPLKNKDLDGVATRATHLDDVVEEELELEMA
jgi:hypothetical protein